MRVAIRADASSSIGLGHVKRCLALAHALREAGAEVGWVHRALGIDVAADIAATDGRTWTLPAPRGPVPTDPVPHAAWAGVGWQQDADDTIAALAGWRADWVIVDHYAFDARWHRHVSEATAARLAVIDDLADRDLDASVLVDHNLGPDPREKYAGRIGPATRLLCGPRHALIAQVYADGPRWSPRERVDSLGIFMGGVDAAGLSAAVLGACRREAGFEGRIEIATTRANPHLAALQAVAADTPDTRVTVDQPDLADFFARHDLQIGAGGGATWERCCVGAPTLAVCAASNQQAVIPALVARGCLDAVASTEPVVLGRAIAALIGHADRRRELSERSRTLVDGLGTRRVALALVGERLTVRAATLDDARRMHAWRDHPTTRDVSSDATAIAWPDHLAWLERTLQDPRRHLLVGQVGQVPVGVIRFDRRDDGFATVSLYLDPTLHGLGLGRLLLLAGEHECMRATRVAGFVATVLPGNTVSQRMFENCGYRLDDGRWWKHRPSTSDPTGDTP